MSDVKGVAVVEDISVVEVYENIDDVNRISFHFGFTDYIVDPSQITIDENDLVREFAKQASRYAYIAVLASYAESDVKRAKMNLKHEQAAASIRARVELVANDIKVTEKAVETKASIDDGVHEIQESLLDAERVYGLLKALESSYRMRADMMVSLGTRLRMEMEQTGMTMKKTPESLMRQVVEDYKEDSK